MLKSYLEYLEKELNYSVKTIRNYKLDIMHFEKYLNNFNKKRDIEKDDVRTYLKSLDKDKLSNKTISRKLSSLRSYYNFLVEVGEVDQNIFLSIKNPKSEKKLPNYLSEEETEILLSSFKRDDFFSVRNHLIIELIYSCGFRLSEVINIKTKYINSDENQIKILGKGSKERLVYFSDYTKKLINDYLQEYYSVFNKGSEYLFINKSGSRLSTSMVHKIIKSQRLKAGLTKDLSAHSLRHSFATDLLNNGASIDTVKNLLGHSSLATTQVYTHIATDKIKNEYLKAHPRSEK